MKQTLIIYIIPLLVLIVIWPQQVAKAQEGEAIQLIERILEQQDTIEDYTANVEIEVDVDFIKMPVKNAVVLFKKPDMVRFRSDGFLLLPKRGTGLNLSELLNEDFTAIYGGLETIDGKPHRMVKIVPDRPKKGMVLSTLWIDEKNNRVRRMENFTKEGVYTIDLFYEDHEALPSLIIVSFEVEGLNIPLNFVGKTIEIDKEAMKAEGPRTGRIYLRFSEYQINSGLEDSQFTDE